jgi:RHS repeat-associated protein
MSTFRVVTLAAQKKQPVASNFSKLLQPLVTLFIFFVPSIAQAAGYSYSYSYTSATLTPATYNQSVCPAVSNIKASVYYVDPIDGAAIADISAGPYSVNSIQGVLVTSNGTVSFDQFAGYSNLGNSPSVSISLGAGGEYDHFNLGFVPLGDGTTNYAVCDYASTTPGTWSGGINAKSFGVADTAISATPNPGDGCTKCGNPIDAATGNKFQAETDYSGPAHTGLSLTRYYNSGDSAGSAFGAKWHSTWHRGLTVAGNIATVTRADGRKDAFINNSASIWIADADVTSRLSPVPASGTQTGWALTLPDDSVENYTLAGQLSSVVARTGLSTSLAYNGSGNLTTVAGPFGHTLSFTYDSSNRVSRMTVPDGGTYVYAYDSNNNLFSVIYPDSTVRQYAYTNSSFPNALTGIIDELGNIYATFAYDSNGRATSTQHAGGAELTTVTYNTGGTSTITDARGNAHTLTLTTVFSVPKLSGVTGQPVSQTGGKAFTYDSNGFIASSTDWDGNVTTYTHDASGVETSRVMASGTPLARTITTAWDATFDLPMQITDGNRVFSFAYDANGNLLSRTLTSAGAASKWSYTYNSAGQALTATDPVGNVTAYAYDARGNLVRVTNALGQVTLLSSYDANGRPLKIQDPNGLVTTLTYNFRGQVTSKTEGQWVTIYSYDAAGQLIRLTRPDRSFLTFTYDPAHRLIGIADSLGNRMAYTLDAASNRIQEQVFAASGALSRTRSYAYDAVNRLSQAIGALGQATHYSYDPNGNLTQISDPLGHTTTRTYDPLNRLIGTTDANGGVTGFSYDALSRLAGVTDPRGLATSYAYDGLNDVTSLNSPDTGLTARTYDAAGNVVASKDARARTTTYTYDGLNRVTQAAFADGTAILYQYDQGANGVGRLTAMTDPSGTTRWAYDIHGRVTEKDQTSGGLTRTTSRTYNAVTGQLANTIYPSGSTIVFSYDANGRIGAIGYHRRRIDPARPLLSQIAYQPFGPASSWLTGNGASYSRTFDQDGRIAQLVLPSGNTSRLGYDAASRITGIAETGLPAKAFGYDALDRIVNYASGTTTQTYAYDASGNRTGFTEKQPPFVNAALTYRYDKASNRLLAIGGSWNERFAYDANGNMTSHTLPFSHYTYAYDTRNRRTQTFVGAVPTTDVLNGLGQRTSQIYRGAVQQFVYDEAGHLTGSYNQATAATEETVWLGDLPVAVLSAVGEQRYIAPDHLGAPHEITNATGQVVWQWDHDPFGNGQPSGTFSYGLRFPGQFYDQSAGLHYNYFRDYDPRTGRYIQSDPIGLLGGINTYGYARQSPLDYLDRSGLAIGDWPSAPPGYDPKTWKWGLFDDGQPVLQSPEGVDYIPDPEDKGHWRHWDKWQKGKFIGRCPVNAKKPWPSQKKPPDDDQSTSDPSGNDPPLIPPFNNPNSMLFTPIPNGGYSVWSPGVSFTEPVFAW